jgi:hypothetical protein
VLAIIYLTIYLGWRIYQRQPWRNLLTTKLLIAIVAIVIFFATEVVNKTGAYLPHLTTWFAIAIGVLISHLMVYVQQQLAPLPLNLTPLRLDATQAQGLPPQSTQPANQEVTNQATRPAAAVLGRAPILLWLLILAVALSNAYVASLPLARYQKSLRTVNDVDYQQMMQTFQQVITPDLIPVGSTRHWYLFAHRPEYRAFSRRLARRLLAGEFPSEQYAVILNIYERRQLLQIAQSLPQPQRQFQPLAALPQTPYGPLWIYYLGNNPDYLSRRAVTVAPDQ